MSQRYRIVDALLESEVVFNYAWKDVSIIPAPGAAAPGARARDHAAARRARGRGARRPARRAATTWRCVEVSPVGFAEPGPTEADRLAHRLWLLRRQELKAYYERLGVAVATWGDRLPVDAALEEVRAFRRHARLARA